MTMLPNPFLSAASLQPAAEVILAATRDARALALSSQAALANGFAPKEMLMTLSPPEAAASSPLGSLSEAINSNPDGGYMGPRLSPALGTSVNSAVALSRTSVLDAQTDATAVTLSNRPLDVPPGPKLPAASSTVAAGLSDDDLYWQLRFADDPFTRDLAEIPDPHAFFNKIIEVDVWADDAPLFLRSIA